MSADREAVAAVSAAWDRRAGAHNAHYGAFSEASRAQWREMYRHAIVDLLGPGHGRIRALDVGTGTGFVSSVLAELGHDITGVDDSERMLEHAAAEARRRGVEVRLRRHDAHEPVTGSQPFDLITARNVVWTLPDPATALGRWRAALRPGGAVVIADGLWRPRRHAAGLARDALRRDGDRALLAKTLRDYAVFSRRVPYWRGITAAQAQDLLASVGFAEPQRFDHLIAADARPAGAEFFVLGART